MARPREFDETAVVDQSGDGTGGAEPVQEAPIATPTAAARSSATTSWRTTRSGSA